MPRGFDFNTYDDTATFDLTPFVTEGMRRVNERIDQLTEEQLVALVKELGYSVEKKGGRHEEDVVH